MSQAEKKTWRSSRFGRWRARRKARRAEQAFLGKLTPSRPADLLAAERVVPAKGDSLRRLLFIADPMWERDELLPELERICEVDLLDVGPALRTGNSGSILESERVARLVSDSEFADPDLIFVYLRPLVMGEEFFEALRRRWGCPVIGMNLDDRVQFHAHGVIAAGCDNYRRWVNHFDLNLTSSKVAVDWYHEAGAPAMFVPQGFCRREICKSPPSSGSYAHDLSFAGSWKPERGRLVDGLRSAGHEVAVFGKGWPDSQWVDHLPSLFRGSQLNLGVGYVFSSAGVTSLKGRDTECPAAGACYLTTWHWELPELFDVGKEILCYRNLDELLEVLAFYLPRPEECHRIAVRAHQRAWRDHAWEFRMRSVFERLGFKIPR